MPSRPLTAALAGSPDDVEAQFYQALVRGDIEQLMALWADDDDIVCVHPGGPRVIGAGAIRASFEGIFAHGGIAVTTDQVHRLQFGSCALHHLVECVQVPARAASAGSSEAPAAQTAYVLATNCFVLTAQGWRLVSHHASPGTLHRSPDPSGSDAQRALH
jgi:ketosteroid isomerase-like protein